MDMSNVSNGKESAISKRVVTQHICIDSGNRDVNQWPYSHTYNLPLDRSRRFKNVIGFNLLEAALPRSQPTFNDYCCVIQFKELGQDISAPDETITLTLPNGYYTSTSAVSLIQTMFDNKQTYPPCQHSYKVTGPDRTNGVVSFSVVQSNGDEQFQFLFGTGSQRYASIHHKLGFFGIDSLPAEVISSNFSSDFSTSKYIDIIVPEIPKIATKSSYSVDFYSSDENGQAVQFSRDIVARIPLDIPEGMLKFHVVPEASTLRNHFSPMNLPNISINLVDDHGRPYDACNLEHNLIFEVAILEACPPELSEINIPKTIIIKEPKRAKHITPVPVQPEKTMMSVVYTPYGVIGALIAGGMLTWYLTRKKAVPLDS